MWAWPSRSIRRPCLSHSCCCERINTYARHRVRHPNRNVTDSAQIVRLPTQDDLFTLGVAVGEQFQIDTYRGMPQKANVHDNPAIVKADVASEGRQIHARIIHRAVSVHCLLKAENSAVELGGHVDVVHNDIHVRYCLDISSRRKFRHCSSRRSTDDSRLPATVTVSVENGRGRQCIHMSVLDLFRLDGKKALVTGASSGVGKRVALAYTQAGAQVAIAARNYEALDAARTPT